MRIRILLSLLLISMIILQPLQASSGKTILRKVNLTLLAVTTTGKGSVIPVTIIAEYPGSGGVIIDDEYGHVGEDTIISIRYSLILASLITGIDYRPLDYRIVFPQNTVIEGTSATLDFLLGFTQILTGIKTNEKVGATGLVSPNLVIGNVSGLMAKFEAGLEYGLKEIVGPLNLSMMNMTGYRGFIDIIHLLPYLNLTNQLPVNTSIHVVDPALEKVFSISYMVFYRNITGIIEQYRDRISDEALKEYELGVKYYKTKYKYTAASYMFRAYTDTLKSYYKSLSIENKESLIGKLITWYKDNATRYEKELHTIIKNNKTISPLILDALANSYIRYKLSRDMYSLAVNTSSRIEDRIDLLTTSIARLHTALHWLMIIEYVNNTTYPKRINNWLFNNLYLATLNYFESMKYIRGTPSISSNNTLIGFLDMFYNWYMLGLGLMSLNPPVFRIPRTKYWISMFNQSLATIGLQLTTVLGSMPPSVTTSLEITGRYLQEGEDPSIITGIIFEELMIAVAEYSLWRNMVDPYNHLEVKATVNTYPETHVIGLLEWSSLILIGLGALFLGYSLGRINKSRSSRVSSSYEAPQTYGILREVSSVFENPPRGGALTWDNIEQRQDDK